MRTGTKFLALAILALITATPASAQDVGQILQFLLQKVTDLETENAGQQAEIDALNADSASQQAEIDALNADSLSQQAEIDVLNVDSLSQQAEIDVLNVDSLSQQAEIDVLNADSISQQSEIVVLNADSASQQAEIDALTAGLDDLMARVESFHPSSLTVFVTADIFQPAIDFVGLAGADDVCQQAAEAAFLPGTFLPWLSDDTASPASRFTQATVPYVRVDGVTLADDWNDLIDCANPSCLQAGIDLDENGLLTDTAVWTGTSIFGTAQGGDCLAWTSADPTRMGQIGRTITMANDWTAAGPGVQCDQELAFYCFQQLPGAAAQ